MKKLALRIQQNWYKPAWYNLWLLPLWLLVALFIFLKRRFFLMSSLKHNPLPVVVVGHIPVGVAGTTPLIAYLVDQSGQLGLTPGVISRGYGGKSHCYPLSLTPKTTVSESGDEPYLLYHRLGCPVVVDPNRRQAAEKAIEQGVNIIFSDDGMQHYAL